MLNLSKTHQLHHQIIIAILTMAFNLSCGAPSRAAIIYAYEFNIGSYISNNDLSLFGTAADLSIFLSNGNSTNKNQIYTYADIVGVAATTIGGTFGIAGSTPQTLLFTGNSMADIFATTNAQGAIELISDVNGDSFQISANGGAQNMLWKPWFLRPPPWWIMIYDNIGDGAFGVPQTVTPLPTALPLFASGLGAMGLFGWCRKRKAAASSAIT